MTRVLIAVLTMIGALASFNTAVLAQNDTRIERVRFAAGTSATTIRDQIGGRDSILYQIDARAGQVLNVSLDASNAATYFNIYAPGRGPGDAALAIGASPGPGEEVNRFDGVLPQTGTYTVAVYLYRSAARRGESSRFTLNIAVSAEKARPTLPIARNDYADGLDGGPDFWEVTGVSPGDRLNMRQGPSTNAPIMARLLNGTTLRNDGCRRSGGQVWCRVETTDGRATIGWVASRYLSEGSAPVRGRERPQRRAETSDDIQVAIQPGAVGTVYAGRLAPGESTRYLLNARNGEFLNVQVGPSPSPLSYQIFNPDQSFLLSQITAERPYRGQLWQSGQHVVEVINRNDDDIDYIVAIAIQPQP